jgi:hypothetical protein
VEAMDFIGERSPGLQTLCKERCAKGVRSAKGSVVEETRLNDL